MSFKVFDSRDEVPEAQRQTAIETKDGKWAVAIVEDVAGLKANKAEIMAQLVATKAKLKELEDAAAATAATAAARSKGLTDEEIAARRKEIDDAKAPLQSQLDAMAKQMRGLQLDSRIKTLLGEAGFEAKRVDAAFRLIADRFELNESGSPILKDKPTADLVGYLRDEVGAKEFPEWVISKQKASTEAVGSVKDKTVSTADAEKLLTSNPMALLAQANAATAASAAA
jgi:hypothetical protein